MNIRLTWLEYKCLGTGHANVQAVQAHKVQMLGPVHIGRLGTDLTGRHRTDAKVQTSQADIVQIQRYRPHRQTSYRYEGRDLTGRHRTDAKVQTSQADIVQMQRYRHHRQTSFRCKGTDITGRRRTDAKVQTSQADMVYGKCLDADCTVQAGIY